MEKRSPDLDLLCRGDKEMQVLGEYRGFMWGGQGQEALMPQIMQRSLGVTTSWSSIQSSSHPPEPATILHYPGELHYVAWIQAKGPFQGLRQISATPHEYRHLYLIADKHDSLTQSGWCRQGQLISVSTGIKADD